MNVLTLDLLVALVSRPIQRTYKEILPKTRDTITNFPQEAAPLMWAIGAVESLAGAN